MLSRTAENLYWLARYVERAEYIARTIDATLRVTALPAAYIGKTNEWESALLTAGVSASFYEAYQEANEQNVVEYLAFSPSTPSSIKNCIEAARLNSRSVRTALTSEMWDTINSAWIELQEVWGKGTSTREELAKFLRFVQETSLRFDGSAYRTMLRNDAYWFSRLGLHLERADNTARILDVKYHVLLPEEEHVGGPLDFYQWTSILRSVSALTAYHWVYRETLKPWLIADLLILNDTLPRSLASCYGNLVRNLDQIGVAYGRQGAAQRHARGVRNRLEHSHMDDIFQHGVHEFIQEFILEWQIDVSTDSRLDMHQDAFGNVMHVLTHGPLADLTINVGGVIETHDTGGVLKGTDERFPPGLFLRATSLTDVNPAMANFANELRAESEHDALGFLHALMTQINEHMTFDEDPTNSGTSAVEAFTLKRGVCQDYAHVFIACARSGGIPARFVSGHFLRSDGMVNQAAGHAWAEAFVPNLGWIGFDPANSICTTDAHARVAIGLDYLGAAPVRGTRYGGGAETLTVTVTVDQAGRPGQWQSQSQ